MTGGNSARWKDEEMAATFTQKAVEFIEKRQHEPFLLYFTPSDIHVPRAHRGTVRWKERMRCAM